MKHYRDTKGSALLRSFSWCLAPRRDHVEVTGKWLFAQAAWVVARSHSGRLVFCAQLVVTRLCVALIV